MMIIFSSWIKKKEAELNKTNRVLSTLCVKIVSHLVLISALYLLIGLFGYTKYTAYFSLALHSRQDDSKMIKEKNLTSFFLCLSFTV